MQFLGFGCIYIKSVHKDMVTRRSTTQFICAAVEIASINIHGATLVLNSPSYYELTTHFIDGIELDYNVFSLWS